MAQATTRPSALERAAPVRQMMLFQLSIGEPIALAGSTLWEELTCVGYNPDTSNLEAVVAIKLPTGYSGGLCVSGSTEFVRFFIDWGTGFVDAGLTSFGVHDIPDTPTIQHPLEYSVELALPVADHRRLCSSPVLPLVRAVLSWNVPPNLDPNQVPIFGNHLDAHIQISPLLELVAAPVALGPVVSAASAIPAVASLGLVELAQAYRAHNVPTHRFLLPAIAPLLQAAPPTGLSLAAAAAELKALGLDLNAAAQAVLQAGGDTSFEELTCVGLATDFDSLAAVIHIKRPYGYSGDLCHAGSLEYVAFWADWNNSGTFTEYLGTAQVQVHDLDGALPGDGLAYAVTLFSPSFAQHLRDCTHPVIVRIRGVLSWAVPPSASDPNALNTWGNRLDALVQLRPGQVAEGLIDVIYRVGGVALAQISPVTFLAYTSLVPPTLADRPWGGLVTISGRLYNTGPAHSVRYRVRYKPHALPDLDANWIPVTSAQTYIIAPPLPLGIQVSQTAGSEPGLGGGWFDYLEDPTTSPPTYEIDSRLADWYTGTLEGIFDLRLEYRHVVDPPGFYLKSSTVTITLHNHNFVTNVVPGTVLDPSLDLDIVILGGDCHSYAQGATINGELRVVDPYFWTWALDVEPASHVHGAAVSPPSRVYTSIADNGDASRAYTIDTSVLDKCGYALILRGWDRTILNNDGTQTHFNSKAVGFSVT